MPVKPEGLTDDYWNSRKQAIIREIEQKLRQAEHDAECDRLIRQEIEQRRARIARRLER